jgi:phosphoribosylformylglycinamidine cyclo-ligase
MNVNDVLCVGAEPLAVLDYIAVEVPHVDLLESLARGLYRGAELAAVTIPGGEIAQVREMIRGVRQGYAFDLVATCVGQVPVDRILTGQDIQEGDVIVGLSSSGVHSNGFTLVRRIFFDQLKWSADHYVDELGRTIGEALIEPTRIYVKEVLAMLRAGLRVKALAHITSSGFLNLSRASAPVGYVLDSLPEPPPIFQLIQRCGNVTAEEMFFTYNMGIGFCVVTAPGEADVLQRIAREHGVESHIIGHAVADPEKKVTLPKYGLVGRDENFFRQ